MPLTETELTLVEAMFMNNHSVKSVLQVLPHAVVSTLYRQKKTFDTYGSIHKPETTSKRRLRKPVVADAKADASPADSETSTPKDPLSETDRTVEMLFEQGCSVRVVQSWFPNKPKSSLYRMQKNFQVFGSVRKPETMYKKKGRPSTVTPEMKEWLIELVKDGKELWQRDLAYELFTKFGVFVSASTISRLLKEQNIVKKLGPVETADTDMASDEEDEEDVDTPITEQVPNLDPLLQWA
jgi:transposase